MTQFGPMMFAYFSFWYGNGVCGITGMHVMGAEYMSRWMYFVVSGNQYYDS